MFCPQRNFIGSADALREATPDINTKPTSFKGSVNPRGEIGKFTSVQLNISWLAWLPQRFRK